MTKLLFLSIIVLILNIPFGYWRANVVRFSLQWYLSIHIPVPFIIALRIFFHTGFGWETYLFMVVSFFIGQKLGSIIHKYLEKTRIVSSCLIMDLGRQIWKH